MQHDDRRPTSPGEALADCQAQSERTAGTAAHERNCALTERFRQGRGIDLDVLLDENSGMRNHEA